MSHSIPIRIYYEDTDAGGIVYHARYLNFGERGRTEFLRHLGYENSQITHEHGIIFVIRHIEIDYLLPMFLDDLVTQVTGIEEIRNSSFVMRQRIYRHKNDANETLLSDMRVSLVCVDTNNYRPVRLPDFIKEAFQPHIESE